MTTERPQILWFGDGAPTTPDSRYRILPAGAIAPREADAIVLAAVDGALPEVDSTNFIENQAPIILRADGLGANPLRAAINRYSLFRVVTDPEMAAALASAVAVRAERRERELALAHVSQRTRDLERMTESLERAVAERTSVLEASTLEEREKLGRERHLIRFLNDLSMLNASEDVLRVLRRELRRFHRIQSLVLIVGETGRSTQFFCSQGDKILRAESVEDLGGVDEKTLRQLLANRFSRPFNKLLLRPLEMRAPARGVLGVEYSLLGEDEIREISEILQERSRPVGMTVERLSHEDRQRRFAIRWERTFDGIRDPISVVDAELNVLRGNRSFSTDVQRKKCFEIFAGRSEPCEHCPVGTDARSSKTLEGVVRVGRRSYRLRSWPVRDAGGGGAAGRVTHYDDVTESRELSLRMLQNEKMSAIGELAGHIAHELNNPLTGIRSLAQVLRAEYPTGTLSEDLGQIENAARRCQTIIHHLLEFSKGGDDVKPVRFDEIVEMTLPLLKTALRRHRQEILLQAGKAKVLANSHLLQQVVFNLVNNACQAMREPGTVGIATKAIEDGGARFVELRVLDSGPGVPPEVRARLFEPFVTTKPEGEGTGLGLSTSKAIVERFGGAIRLESSSARGTEFVLRFPRKDSE